MKAAIEEALGLLDSDSLPQAYFVLKRAMEHRESALVQLLLRELVLFRPCPSFSNLDDLREDVLLRRARAASPAEVRDVSRLLEELQAPAATADSSAEGSCAAPAAATSPWKLVLEGAWLLHVIFDPEGAVAMFARAHEVGNAAGTYNLACCYQRGVGVQCDVRRSADLLRSAAEQSHAWAQVRYAEALGSSDGCSNSNSSASSFASNSNSSRGHCHSRTKSASDEEAVRLCRLAVAQGVPDAQALLGHWLLHGAMGLERDAGSGVVLLLTAADHGSAAALYRLGLCFHRGDGVRRSDIVAANYWKLAADRGSAEALYQLGLCYRRGEGVRKDARRSLELLHASALQGSATAKCALAVEYKHGGVVPRDLSECVRLLRSAADLMDPVALYNLGLCHERGEGVQKSVTEAAHLYALAAGQGYPPAQRALGLCLMSGAAEQRRPEEAVRLFRLAAAQGYAPAQCSLAMCYEREEGGLRYDPLEVARLYKLAAAQGEAHAQCSLAWYYHAGEGVTRDVAEAVRLTRLAAGRGITAAIFNLAMLYKTGEGVERDLQEAERLMRIAASKGSEGARKQHAKMISRKGFHPLRPAGAVGWTL
eukprot:m51a1_g6951 hypothetical protein (595) ;mRNA; f:27936-29780